MIYHNLYAQCGKASTSVALIGVGHFGATVLAQSLHCKRLIVAAIADKSLDAIRAAAEKAELDQARIAECATVAECLAAIEAGKLIAATNPLLLMELPIDTIVEGTGNPEAGAVHALAAIKCGKNIVMVNKETDSCVGPILRKLADEKGVVCTPVDGDQHGVLMQMVEWARDCGMEVISAGKSRDAEFIYDRKAKTVTVFSDGGITIDETISISLSDDECALMETLPKGDRSAALAKRKEILARLDPRGGFDLCEMVIAANATGLRPDVDLMHDAVLRTPEIPAALCAKKDGGILGDNGIIEVVTNLHETGEAGLGGGVFLVVSCANGYSQMILNTKGCISNDTGSCALIYRPYHLCGVEAPSTLLTAGLLGIATGSREYRQSYDIVQEAKTDLKAGDVMGNDHDPRLLTRMVPASPIAAGGPVPAHLLNGRALLRDVPAGTVITYGMIENPGDDSTLWSLRKMQDTM